MTGTVAISLLLIVNRSFLWPKIII